MDLNNCGSIRFCGPLVGGRGGRGVLERGGTCIGTDVDVLMDSMPGDSHYLSGKLRGLSASRGNG